MNLAFSRLGRAFTLVYTIYRLTFNISECTQYGTCTVEHPSKHSEAVKVSDEDKMEPNYHQWFPTLPGGLL